MTKTVTQLATAVLRELGAVDAAETPDSEDITYVESVYRDKWEELSAHGTELTYWPYDTIPNPVFLVLRDLVMLEVMGAFGTPLPPGEKEARETIILKKLRRHTSVQSSGRPTEADYF